MKSNGEYKNNKTDTSVFSKAIDHRYESNDFHFDPEKLNATLFCPGEFYYYILNTFDISMQYVHPSVYDIIGCSPEEFTLRWLLEHMDPEEAKKHSHKELAVTEFFQKRIPPEKAMQYKASYTFRIKNRKGCLIHMLHQSMPIRLTPQGHVQHLLSVHTDITFMNLLIDDRISFIGLEGQPSYYSLSSHPHHKLKPDICWQLSRREAEILKLLAEGLGSKQIADRLTVSTHTVDTHRRNLLKKTNTKNTLELAVACVKKGLI